MKTALISGVNGQDGAYLTDLLLEEGSCTHPDYPVERRTEVVAIDTQYYRPTEVDLLIGDLTKAKIKLGWQRRYELRMLVKEMMVADVEFFTKEKILKEKGYITQKAF